MDIQEVRERINEIKARLRVATPGPWVRCDVGGQCYINEAGHRHGAGKCDYRQTIHEHDHDIYAGIVETGAFCDDAIMVCGNYDYEAGGVVRKEDADFIVHAREDVPYLLDLLSELLGEK
jgi:hypothetical protein